MSQLKKSSLHFLLLSASSYTAAGLSLLIQTITAKNSTPETLGTLNALLYLTLTLAPLCGFGVSQYILRLYGEHGDSAKKLIPQLLRFTITSTTTTIAFLFLVIAPLQDTPQEKLAAILISIIAIANLIGELVSSTLQLERKFKKLSAWGILHPTLRLALLLGVVQLSNGEKLDLTTLASIYAACTILFMAAGIPPIIRLSRGRIIYQPHEPHTQQLSPTQATPNELIKNIIPYGLSNFFFLVYFQSNIFIVKTVLSPESAGFYSVAFTIISATTLLPGVIYQKLLLPQMHHWAFHDKEKLHKIYATGNIYLTALGVIISIPIYLFSEEIISVAFGAQYLPASKILETLSLSIPLFYLASSAGATLSTGDNIIKKIKYMGISAAICIPANILLLKTHGVAGAAYSLILAYIIITSLYIRANTKYVFRDNPRK